MTDLAGRLGVSTPVLVLIGMLAIVQIGLAVFALVDLWKRDRVAGGHKLLWVALILIGNFAGSVLYLAIGRDVPPEVVEQPASHLDSSLSHSERIRRGVDALYGPAE
jgi:hypothetical protein